MKAAEAVGSLNGMPEIVAAGMRPPHRLSRRACLQAAACATVSPLAGCAWLGSQENQIALRPTPGRPAGLAADETLFRPNDERWLAPVRSAEGADQQLALWWLPHRNPAAPTLLYLHGTFRNLYQNLPKINALRDVGFSVLAVDYRGWGDSSAIRPDENSITTDAALACAELQRRQPRPARRVVYGHSMGGAVAVRLAAGLPAGEVGALVLESSFTSMPDMAAGAGWFGRFVSWFTSLQFDSLSRMAAVKAPLLLLLHGSADTTVPVALGRRLRDAAPAAAAVRWVEISGGTHSRLHSEAPDIYNEAFRTLMNQLATLENRAAPAAPTVGASPSAG